MNGINTLNQSGVWRLYEGPSPSARPRDKEKSPHTVTPATGNGPPEPLPTSSSHRSLERAFAQKFATLGMGKRPTWRAKFDKFRLLQGPRAIFLFFWISFQTLIFAFSYLIYQRSHRYSHARSILGHALGLSRGAAAVLNVDCGLILFSVCRNLISVLRSTFLNNIVPFDKNIHFHKTIAWSIVVFSVIHTVAHYTNYYHLEQANESGGKTAQQMAILTWTGFTGHVLVLILFLMISSSVERVRRKGFETFWYAHHLFILFFITLMAHGAFCFIRADEPPYCKASSYKFVSVSLFLYIVERVLREIRARKTTNIHKIVLHPSKVVEVQMQKDGFKCKAGQYVFLNCPDISAFEWHPFTITSAPEEDYVSVHIRIVGDWTTAFTRLLGCSFDDERQYWIEELLNKSTETIPGTSTAGFSTSASVDISEGNMRWHGQRGNGGHAGSSISVQPPRRDTIALPRVLLDGPYGSPSEDAFNYEIAVLVGAGIGVTPFASVLKHIWYSVVQPTKIIALRKAFEWFQDLLIALEEQNLSEFLEIRSYLTGELDEDELNTIVMEAKSAVSHEAVRAEDHPTGTSEVFDEGVKSTESDSEGEDGDMGDTEEEDEDRDAITGLRSPTYYGRPNFDKIFNELSAAHPPEHGRVGVFFCGPKRMGETLHRCARKYNFEFHKGKESTGRRTRM
ncbi:hypothetical protein BGW41_005520 [Actinomortierella wolfii]|nr:hypothetical protein BGW41_005520 [Actinomortierella wolfii]